MEGTSCGQCGAALRANVQFCPSCGAARARDRGARMSIGKLLIGVLVVMMGGAALLGGCVYQGYQHAIRLDESVKSAWAEVENQLQRRFELIPNLQETVKGFAAQEREIFLGVADARKSYFQANSVKEKAVAATQVESAMSTALSRLLVLQEQYPELKSDESFLKFQDSVEGTENRLVVARQRYNEEVKTLNTFARGLLGRLYASFARVEEAEYFNVSQEAKTAPRVDFSTKPAAP